VGGPARAASGMKGDVLLLLISSDSVDLLEQVIIRKKKHNHEVRDLVEDLQQESCVILIFLSLGETRQALFSFSTWNFG
jgi:hypothetical protein